MRDVYGELPPPPVLGEHVTCLWWGTDDATAVEDVPAEPGYILPDGCLDIIWVRERLIVAGPDTAPVRREPGLGGAVAGLRFRPGRAGSLLGVAADELTDQRIDLEQLWAADAARLADELHRAPPRARPHLIADHVERRLARARPIDRIAAQAADEIGRRRGRVSIAALADDLAISERQLRRRCTSAVGYGPKTLARVMRFQHALALTRRGHALAEVAAVAGYADQAHLTRDVVELSARPPSAHQRASVAP
jgi:AraC-like DNA-binding protein